MTRTRNYFITPIPEIEEAVTLLGQAADAFLSGYNGLAGKLIARADDPEIAKFYRRIVGKTDPKIHWQSSQPKNPVPKSERSTTRMPSPKKQTEIFQRDGWRCRYCGTRVISRAARKVFILNFPVETHWVSSYKYGGHSALLSQGVSLDHIRPISRGGDNEPDNFVTACGTCQFGRNQWTLEEVGFTNPKDRPPVVDGWDGLTRLLKAPRTLRVPT